MRRYREIQGDIRRCRERLRHGLLRAYGAAISAPDVDLAVHLAARAARAALATNAARAARAAALLGVSGGAAPFPLGEDQTHPGAAACSAHTQAGAHAHRGGQDAGGPPLAKPHAELTALATAPAVGEPT